MDEIDGRISASPETERLRLMLQTSYDVCARLETDNERLRQFVQKVALFCNDPWLAREADRLAPGAELSK